jgi:hypothetical protein
MRTHIPLLVVMILLVMVVSTSGIVINVPGDEPTIQEGVRAADDGDTVLVAPGTYSENIKIFNKNIVLASYYILDGNAQFIENTVIDGSAPAHPDTGSCVIIAYGQDYSTVLEGFTLTGGTGTAWQDLHDQLFYREGGGVLMDLCAPIIRNNHIVDNEATSTAGGMASAGGGGIRSGDSNPLIEGNIVENNRGRYGAGIVMFYSTGVIRRNVIIDNTGGQDFGGGGIWLSGDGLTVIENNTIVGNSSTGGGTGGTGGAIFLAGDIYARNNIVWGNTQSTAGQLYGTRQSEVIYNCVEGGYEGLGNIDQDPLFADDSYTLSANSPCIDSGDPNSPLDPDGTRADMGAKLYYHFDAPYIWFVEYTIDDSDGNANGIAESGETVDVVVTLLNTSMDATGVTATFTCGDPEVELNQDTSVFGDMAQDMSASNEGNPFSFSVGQDASAHRVTFDLVISADGGYGIEYTLDLIIGTSTILLVDDDGGTSLEAIYMDALETKGIFPAHWDAGTKGRPTTEAMQQYEAAIWFTGDDRETSLTSEEQAVIADYLDGGGRLLIAGPNIGYDLVEDGSAGDAAFYADYLHAEYVSDAIVETFLYGVEGDPITGQFTFFALDADQISPDVIAPLEGASTSMIYFSTQQAAAVKYSNGHRIVYFALGFESIGSMSGGSNEEVQGILLDNAIRWLTFVPVETDVNQDGQVNILDVLATVNIILGILQPTPDQEWAADCNADGNVDILDALGIINSILGINTCPPMGAVKITPATMEYLQSLEPYLGAGEFTRLMTLVGDVQVPDEFNLSQNYPNPFNPVTDIRYQIPDGRLPIQTTLKVYNVLGQEVCTLVNQMQEPGSYDVRWDASDMASGVYFYRLTAGEFTSTKRMVLMK